MNLSHKDFEHELDICSATYSDLENKNVVITGGGSGIGASLVSHFCRQKANVYFCDIDINAAEEVLNYVDKFKCGDVKFSFLDVTNLVALTDWFRQIEAEAGQIHCVINNAGNDLAKSIQETDEDFLIKCFELNLKHQYLLAKIAAKHMQQFSSGCILNMGSISWMIGVEGVSAYTTMKAAISGMTNSFSRELGRYKIRVNSIAPGWILTEKQRLKGSKYPEKFSNYLNKQAWKEHLSPADIARLALWLASGEAKRVTGQTFILDGGVV